MRFDKSVSILGTLALTGFSASFFLYTSVRANSVRKPYFAQTYIQHFANDGKMRETTILTDAVRGDGSMVRDTTLSSDTQNAPPRREIYLVPERVAIVSDAGSKTKWTRAASPDGINRRIAGLGSCLTAHPNPFGGPATCVPSNETRLGHPVDILNSEHTNSQGVKTRVTARVARDLEWQPLEYAVYIDGVLRELREVRYLVEGEPPSALFQVPANFKEVGPAEFMKQAEAFRGHSVAPAILAGVAERNAPR